MAGALRRPCRATPGAWQHGRTRLSSPSPKTSREKNHAHALAVRRWDHGSAHSDKRSVVHGQSTTAQASTSLIVGARSVHGQRVALSGGNFLRSDQTALRIIGERKLPQLVLRRRARWKSRNCHTPETRQDGSARAAIPCIRLFVLDDQELLPGMIQRSRGSIITTASGAARLPVGAPGRICGRESRSDHDRLQRMPEQMQQEWAA